MVETTRGRTRLTPEVRREQIIDAAVGVLAGREPAEVTFEEIADAAGVSRALVYNYFGDRGGLLSAVCERAFDQLDAATSPAFERPDRPAHEQAREFVSRYLGFAAAHPGSWSLIGSTAASEHPALLAVRRRRVEAIADRWGGSAEARVVAAAVMGMLDAVVADARDGDPLAIDDARLSRLVSALLWSGLSRLVPEGAAGRTPPASPGEDRRRR
jgi:AcrR family transcriptional regulator